MPAVLNSSVRCAIQLEEMVEGEGFEPSKAEPTDLQSAPFGRSGIPPRLIEYLFTTCDNGADYRNRTGDLLITSQLLYLLS